MRKKLFQAAMDVRKKAHAPYSQFQVGAAFLTEGGEIVTGCNVENASYGLSNCAERTAIFKAVSEGVHQFTGLAIVADTLGPAFPCGACRQVIAEFCDDEMPIWLYNVQGECKETNLQELLPGAFRKDDLDGK